MDVEKRIEELLAVRGTGEKRAQAMRTLAQEVALECAAIADAFAEAHAKRHTEWQQNLADLVADEIRKKFISAGKPDTQPKPPTNTFFAGS